MTSESGASWTEAFLGIGSNLGDPVGQVNRAFAELSGLPQTHLTACSFLYRTAPVGPAVQPSFINAAARLKTRLGPPDLLHVLQTIERRHGRRRDGRRWGPRTLDLDILIYGDAVVDQPGLRIPHPELAKRAFVLVPLADVAPAELSVPGQGTLERLIAGCPIQGVRWLGPPRSCGRWIGLAESPILGIVGAERSSPQADECDNEPSP